MYNEFTKIVFQYEKEIGNQYNIMKGEMLSKNEKDFILSNMNAFLIGLISDQSVKAETAWSLPYKLKERLGHFDIFKIATRISIEQLTTVIKQKPALHRYPGNIAKYIIAACQMIIEKYDGDAKNIWSHRETASQIIERLEEFNGIGHKKAALGCLLLVRDLEIDIADKENIDIAYDVHIRRICLRLGMAKEDTIEEITKVGKTIYPEFPGRLTTTFWAIGRDICRPQNPLCMQCPINQFCRKAEVKYTDFDTV